MSPPVLFKAFALAVAAVCWRISMTSPNPPPTVKDQVYKGNSFERFNLIAAFVCKNFTVGLVMAEIGVYLVREYPSVFPQTIVDIFSRFGGPSTNTLLDIPFPFAVALILVVAGTAIRVWCYRTLGRHFTFQVSLLHDHKLITDGPYAYVRHPGYAGCIPLFVGMVAMVSAPYEWVGARGVMSTPLCVAIELWLFMISFVAYGLFSRMSVEDSNLKARFGNDWEIYAKHVPYKLFPGVY